MARGNGEMVQEVEIGGTVFKRGRRRATLGSSWLSADPDAAVLGQARAIAAALDAGGSSEADERNQRRALQVLSAHRAYLDPDGCPPALQTVVDALFRRMTIDSRLTWVPRCARWGLRLEDPETDEVVCEPNEVQLHLRNPEKRTETLCARPIEPLWSLTGPVWEDKQPTGFFAWAKAHPGEFSARNVCAVCNDLGLERKIAAATASWDDHLYGEPVQERLGRACLEEMLSRIEYGPEISDELVHELEYQVERALTEELAPLVAEEILGRGVDWLRREWLGREPWGVLLRRAEGHMVERWTRSGFRYFHSRQELSLLAQAKRPRKRMLCALLSDSLEAAIPLDSFAFAKEETLLNYELLPRLVYQAWPEVARALLDPEIDWRPLPLESTKALLKLQKIDQASAQPLWPQP